MWLALTGLPRHKRAVCGEGDDVGAHVRCGHVELPSRLGTGRHLFVHREPAGASPLSACRPHRPFAMHSARPRRRDLSICWPSRCWPSRCCLTTFIACGGYRRAMPITPTAGRRSRPIAAARCRRARQSPRTNRTARGASLAHFPLPKITPKPL